jgi:predicted RNase H-like HicB family nuclease
MLRHFELEYWEDDGWYVGRLKEIPGVFSQGESLEELEKNVKEAYQMMMEDEEAVPHVNIHRKEVAVEV